MLLGRYKTPTGAVSIRKFLRQRDAVFTTKHYWKLYSGVVIIHALINPWLVVWMAFNFIHGWFFLTYFNYFGQSWVHFWSFWSKGSFRIKRFSNQKVSRNQLKIGHAGLTNK